MYDRHKNIIKWYEYDATKLVQNAESTSAEAGNNVAPAVNDTSVNAVGNAPVADNSSSQSATGNAELDAEVARVMAQFTSAKQDGVDSVFAAMGS